MFANSTNQKIFLFLGLEEVGIYRIPGAAVAVNKLRAAFNKSKIVL